MIQLSHEDIKTFVETQLACWPMAKANYDALRNVSRRVLRVAGHDFILQHNPARIRSTAAKVDSASVSGRPCFLCRANRPAEQLICGIKNGWEMLVNPYPILPIHLTIVSNAHRPQEKVPEDIAEIATALPGMAVFFNGASAGASAPDHLHLQAVLKDELPLVRLVEKYHNEGDHGLKVSADLLPDFPYLFFSGVVGPDMSELKTLVAGLNLGGPSCDGSYSDQALANKIFWLGEGGTLRFIVIPRKAHRPGCFYKEGKERRLVSPGTIDMAGMLILPDAADFDSLTSEELLEIFSDVAIQ